MSVELQNTEETKFALTPLKSTAVNLSSGNEGISEVIPHTAGNASDEATEQTLGAWLYATSEETLRSLLSLNNPTANPSSVDNETSGIISHDAGNIGIDEHKERLRILSTL